MYEYKAKVLKVVDGDTIDLEIDHGMHIKSVQRIRLYGIDAPERFTPDGREATTWLRGMIENEEVTIRTIKDRTEKYGRYLGEIFIDGDNVAEMMIAQDMAKPYLK